jgi:hypothetical protein
VVPSHSGAVKREGRPGEFAALEPAAPFQCQRKECLTGTPAGGYQRIVCELKGLQGAVQGVSSPMVTADISAILWIRIAVIEGYLRERDEDLGTRRA